MRQKDGEGRRKGPKNSQGIGLRMKKAMAGQRMAHLIGPGPPRRNSLMMSPVRRRIFSLLCKQPCMTVGAISRCIATSRANATWHLEKLVQGSFITKKRFGGRWIFSPTNLLEDTDMVLLSTLGDERTKRVYGAIRKESGLNQGRLGRLLGSPRQALAWHLAKLQKVGLVETLDDGRYRRYSTTPLLEARARAHNKKLSQFKGLLIRALKEDGTDPVVVKSLARSFVIRIRFGSKPSVLEIGTDPFGPLLSK